MGDWGTRDDVLPEVIISGCDVILFSDDPNADLMRLVKAVADGRLTQERVDEAVTRVLGLSQSERRRRQEVEARMRLTHAALEHFDDLGEHGDVPPEDLERLRDRYQARLDRLRERLEAAGGHPDHRTEAARAQIDALDASRSGWFFHADGSEVPW